MDTAAMLVASRALGLVSAELDGVAAACAELAEAHRRRRWPAGRCSSRPCPTTFGLKAAGLARSR